MTRNTAIQKLADLIEQHPDCHFEIDNDCWFILDKDANEITNSEKWGYDTQWYGHSSNYGFALSEAMIELLNRRGLNIAASAV